MKLRLNVRTPRGSHFVFEHEGPLVGVGREESNDLCLRDDNVSGRHARLELRDGSAFIEDRGSTNGTYVNNHEVVQPTRLKAGDEIKFGRVGPRATVAEIMSHDSTSASLAGLAVADARCEPHAARRSDAVNDGFSCDRSSPHAPTGNSPGSTSTRALVVEMQKKQHKSWFLGSAVIVVLCGIGALAFGVQQLNFARLQSEGQELRDKTVTLQDGETFIHKKLSDVSGAAAKADTRATDAQNMAAVATEESRKAMMESIRQRELFNQATREVSANVSDLIDKMDRLAANPPPVTLTSTVRDEADDNWVIDQPQNIVWLAQWGQRYRAELRYLSPLEIRIRPPKAAIEVRHPAEKVHTIWMFDDIISYNSQRKRLETRFTYYAFDDPPRKAVRIPSKNRKTFATSAWAGMVFRSSGQKGFGILCHLHDKHIGLGLLDEVARELRASEIRHIVTNHGIYVYDPNSDTLLVKSFEELRKEMEERSFEAMMKGMEVLKSGFDVVAERYKYLQEVEKNK